MNGEWTEPETDYAVWGFDGEPPHFAGGELAEEDHHSDAREIAAAAGSTKDAACYLVSNKSVFEAAVLAAEYECANMNEIDYSDEEMEGAV